MPGHERDALYRIPRLEEPGGRLMTQVMKAQIHYAELFARASERRVH